MSAPTTTPPDSNGRTPVESVVIRFAGDSGDGMQLTGTQFTQETALAGNDLSTFPDFPAEIRAPAGTTFGVSAFQIHFGSQDVRTSGDALDVLVAMNPAALKVNVADVREGGTILVDTGSFNERNLAKAGYESSPLEDDTLAHFKVLELNVSKLTLDAVKELGLSSKEALRCKNFWTLGLMLWMYGRSRKATTDWVNAKFSKRPELIDANLAALNAGHAFGETAELSGTIPLYQVGKSATAPGVYRAVTGTEALAYGLLVGARKAGLHLFFGSYPITPASQLLHTLARLHEHGVTTFQAEDEIAAACSAIGASYAGGLGITSSSGPGIALKTEAIGLAISTELPLVIIDTQRAGPSTGMPTKTEQSDLFQAVLGRNGDAPLAVLSASTPADCFDVGVEAVRIATTFMTPVMVMSDGYLANAAEPWRIPDVDGIAPFPVTFRTDPDGFHPFVRDPDTLARAWVRPGTPGLEHRIGGLEKSYETGHISYDPDNHQRMTDIRAKKILGIAQDVPEQAPELGELEGDVAVVGWGSTHGALYQAVKRVRGDGHRVSHIHLRYLWPLPRNLGDLLRAFRRVLVPEMNSGQLLALLRSQYLVPAVGINKVTGKPFTITELEAAIRDHLVEATP